MFGLQLRISHVENIQEYERSGGLLGLCGEGGRLGHVEVPRVLRPVRTNARDAVLVQG